MRASRFTRRDCLKAGLLVPALGLAGAAREEPTSMAFTLKETAGLRRFGYPVATRLPSAASGPNFRLERDGKAIPAQFRTVDDENGKSVVALDFNASPGPLETVEYTVRSGKDVEPGPEPRRGMAVERLPGGGLRVTNGDALAFELPADQFPTFLVSAKNSGREYLLPEPPTYQIHDAGNLVYFLGAVSPKLPRPKMTVTREGTLAVGLRVERAIAIDGTLISMTVDMTFPSSKSWVESVWRVDDPRGLVKEMIVTLKLRLEGDNTLVDLGASDTVYAALKKDQWIHLAAGRGADILTPKTAWEVVRGEASRFETLAAAPKVDSPKAEGWAHVMDARRCTGLAVADFGRATRDLIQAYQDGSGLVSRSFETPDKSIAKGTKTLHWWLHFVPMPVQVGAVTSPQAMLAPLVVDWNRPLVGR